MEASPRQSIKLAIQIEAAKAAPTRQRIIFIETSSTIVTCGEPGLLNDAFCCASQNLYYPQKSCCADNFSNVFGVTGCGSTDFAERFNDYKRAPSQCGLSKYTSYKLFACFSFDHSDWC